MQSDFRNFCILPGLVGDPFLVDVFVQPGQHPHHLAASRAHHDVAAHGVKHVNRLGFPAKDEQEMKQKTKHPPRNRVSRLAAVCQNLPGLPRSRGESVGFGGERSHRTDVDDVARQLRHEHLLHVRPDLQVVSSSCRSQVFDAGDLTGKALKKKKKKINSRLSPLFLTDKLFATHSPDTARALDTARHDGFDERADVFVLHRSLAF